MSLGHGARGRFEALLTEVAPVPPRGADSTPADPSCDGCYKHPSPTGGMTERSEVGQDRIAAVLRDVNRRLVGAASRSALEASVCRVLAESEPYQFAWIGDSDPEADVVRPRASAGDAEGYLEEISIPLEGGSEGPTAAALTTGELQVVQDVSDDERFGPWRESAQQYGLASSAAIPLTHDGTLYGVLNVYADRPGAFDATERELLEELGSTIGNALAGIEAREQLEARTEQYERLTGRISDGFYALDADWTVTVWNEQMVERTGVPAEEVVGRELRSVFPEVEDSEIAEHYRRAMRTGEHISFETYVEPPYDYWADIDVYPDEAGMSVLSRDVTERKRRIRQLEALIENTVNPIYIKDLKGRYQLMNEAAAGLFGLDPEAAIGRTDEELFDAESAVAIEAADREIVERGRPDTEETVRFIDGEKHVFIDNKFPFRDPGGDVVGVMGVSIDITDRKAQEQALAEANQTLEAVITASPDAIIMVDEAGAVTMWNDAAEDLFGWRREEVLGEHAPFVPADKRAEFEELIDQLEAGEPTSGYETVRLTKAGEHIDVSISSAGVDVDGELVGYMATMEDIYERKAYQRRLEDQNSKLEVLNRIVRHDIGNDMQVITGFGELLADRVDDELAEYADAVLASANHAAGLTRTVRDLMETILEESDATEPMKLSRVLDRELDDVHDANEGVVVHRPSPTPRVRVEADDMLGSVFRNVLDNAVRHSDAEPVEISVEVTAEPETVTVAIADNGPGMPAEFTQRAFEKGEKGAASTGTGLGLYLVRTLVDGYGGDVWIEDNEPTGTVVSIQLRRADGDEGDQSR